MRRRNGRWGVAVLLVALAACGAGGPPAQAPGRTPAVAAPAATPDPTEWKVTTPAVTTDYAHIPQSKTPQGYYLLGKPDAPVLLQFYSDFL